MDINILFVFDIIGTIAFAISGVIPAIRNRMDLFGILIIASATAVGGGTLRDLLINVPVAWLHNLVYIYVIIGTVIFAIIFRNKLVYISETLSFFDTIGLAAFTLIGIEKALEAGFSPVICIATGTMTACFGGVIRDTLSNKIPVIFREEIYATACIFGGVTYFSLHHFLPQDVVTVLAGLVVFTVRILSIRYKLKLPTVEFKPGI
ncbi:MAG TPA: trimeric intracellular cation channel family protein [Sphingobacterium sp.]|nr:trimeric intracellular cation channel family protein [Sphingobacterium sp.]